MTQSSFVAGRRLSAVLSQARLIGERDVALSSCCCDARRVRPGDIFVAVIDEARDGHFDAGRAVERGAAAIVAERLLPVSVPLYLVEDSREAYGRLCQSIVGQPDLSLQSMAVAGTHGKTTAALLAASVLRAAGHRTGWATSAGWTDGREYREGDNRAWQAAEYARRLAAMQATACDAAVLEVHSHALAQRRLAGIHFAAALFTNLDRGDPQFPGSSQNHRRATLRLLEQLKPDGLVIANADDPATSLLRRHWSGKWMTVGLHRPADVTATVVERFAGEQTFLLTAGAETAAVRTRMIGDHHVQNCLLAAALGLSQGIELTTVVRGLEYVDTLPGRLERLECGQPFGVFVDGADSPERLAMALRTLRTVTRGRLFCVYGPDGRWPRDLRGLHGRVVERGADYGILTSNNPGAEPFARLADDVIDGYHRPARAHLIPDRRRAIRFALAQARPGDTVLIAGKGDRLGQVLADRSEAFDDAEEARQWLYAAEPDSAAESVTDARGAAEPVILRMYGT